MTFRTGDDVLITCGDVTVRGQIMLASPNEISLLLSFEAILDGHVGMMPVFRCDDGVYRSIVNDVEVRIERAADNLH